MAKNYFRGYIVKLFLRIVFKKFKYENIEVYLKIVFENNFLFFLTKN